MSNSDDTIAKVAFIPFHVGYWYWVVTLGFQIFYWAKNGLWVSVPAIELVVGTRGLFAANYEFGHPKWLLPADGLHWQWLAFPQDWIGLNSAVVWVLSFLSAGALVFLFMTVTTVIIANIASELFGKQR